MLFLNEFASIDAQRGKGPFFAQKLQILEKLENF